MKIKDIKALARETLLDKYATLILAKVLIGMISFILCLLCVVLAGFTLINTGEFNHLILRYFPGFVSSTAAAIIGGILLAALLIFSVIFSVWVEFGYTKLLLKIGRGQKCSTADILYGFSKEAHPWKVLWTGILCYLMVMACLLIPALLQAIAAVCGYVPETASSSDPWAIAIAVVAIITFLWQIYFAFALSCAQLIVIDDPEIDIMDAVRKSMKITRGNKFRIFWLSSFSFLFWNILCIIVPILGIWVLPYIEMTAVLFYLSMSGDLRENPAYRELFINEFAEKVENKVVAHVEDVQKKAEAVAAKAQEAAEAITEAAAEEVTDAAKSAAAEAAAQKAEEIAEKATEFAGKAGEAAEENSFDRLGMRKVHFPDVNIEDDVNRQTED